MSACNENSPIFSKCIGFIFLKNVVTLHVVSGCKISHSAGVIRRSVTAFLLPVVIMCAQIPGMWIDSCPSHANYTPCGKWLRERGSVKHTCPHSLHYTYLMFGHTQLVCKGCICLVDCHVLIATIRAYIDYYVCFLGINNTTMLGSIILWNILTI